MDMNMITQLIGSLGFPIVMCGAMFWKINDQDKKHTEESKNFVQAINNNTEAITKLIETIEKN